MANREALRQLQARLADRLQQVRTDVRSTSWLAVECGRHGFLFPLATAGEIFPANTLMPVPHTMPWFVGVANLRGGLHGVIDLTVFLGLEDRPQLRDATSLIALNPALGSHSAVVVQRLAGLRAADQLQAEPDDEEPRPAFAGGRWRDASGRVWQEIDLAALSRHELFLSIAQ